MAHTTTTAIMSSRLTRPRPASTPPMTTAVSPGMKKPTMQGGLGEGQEPDQGIGGGPVEVEQPALTPPGLPPERGRPPGGAVTQSTSPSLGPDRRCTSTLGSPGQGHAGPGAAAAGRTGHPPVEGPPGEPGPEGKLQQQELEQPDPGHRAARRAGHRRASPREGSGSVAVAVEVAASASPAGVAAENRACLPAGRAWRRSASGWPVHLDWSGRRGPVVVSDDRLLRRPASSRAPACPAGRARRPLADGAGDDARLEQRAGQLAVGQRPRASSGRAGGSTSPAPGPRRSGSTCAPEAGGPGSRSGSRPPR